MVKNYSLRNVVEVTDTPIESADGRKRIRRVEKILMPNGRYRYPVTIIDVTPGYREITASDIAQMRTPHHQFSFEW